jgi:2Fe-2S ferredoxin
LPHIHFSSPGGEEQIIDIPVGWTVMEGATQHGVPGLLAECGGACACATCHIYVDAGWSDMLPPKGSAETDMLSCVEDLRPNSRLACQIKVAVALDGLRVAVADNGV